MISRLFHSRQNHADHHNTYEMIGTTDEPVQQRPRYIGVDGDIDSIGNQVTKSNNDGKNQRISIGINLEADIRTALATVMTKQHRAGPIMKIGAGFCGVSFSLPSEILYDFGKSKVNHKAPTRK
jgi:hypothetical protein